MDMKVIMSMWMADGTVMYSHRPHRGVKLQPTAAVVNC